MPGIAIILTLMGCVHSSIAAPFGLHENTPVKPVQRKRISKARLAIEEIPNLPIGVNFRIPADEVMEKLSEAIRPLPGWKAVEWNEVSGVPRSPQLLIGEEVAGVVAESYPFYSIFHGRLTQIAPWGDFLGFEVESNDGKKVQIKVIPEILRAFYVKNQRKMKGLPLGKVVQGGSKSLFAIGAGNELTEALANRPEWSLVEWNPWTSKPKFLKKLVGREVAGVRISPEGAVHTFQGEVIRIEKNGYYPDAVIRDSEGAVFSVNLSRNVGIFGFHLKRLKE